MAKILFGIMVALGGFVTAPLALVGYAVTGEHELANVAIGAIVTFLAGGFMTFFGYAEINEREDDGFSALERVIVNSNT